MTSVKRHLTSLVTLLIALGLVAASYWPSESGYEFPQIIAIVTAAISAIHLLVTIATRKAHRTESAEAVIPWAGIIPVLLILGGLLLVAERLGFFVTSFMAFSLIAVLYTPGPWSWRRVIRGCAISAIFMGALYAIFVLLLEVQVPKGALI
ncbi:tripartite tricarboxylate transporter TctB family protein [Halomonas piscis]|uniref:Tripartite tricarboxylate transporter TctB family protein n=1 Tax=Halomonas piscis TaxID=3031727 RepID=A0ABY9Z3Q0_9GAMM|nr:tripartite tricarboxylate transporter TctB family protein [Halomonas piscis]WNK21320.1 tripartite tricarboxylate transporter TctB family protein [Halomonas piscis]